MRRRHIHMYLLGDLLGEDDHPNQQGNENINSERIFCNFAAPPGLGDTGAGAGGFTGADGPGVGNDVGVNGAGVGAGDGFGTGAGGGDGGGVKVGHNFQPPVTTEASACHVMSDDGVTPCGPLPPLYACPFTKSLSQPFSVWNDST